VRNHVYLLFLPLRQSRRILPAQTIRQIIRSDPKTAPDGCEVFLPKPAPLPWRVFHFHSEPHSDHSSPVSRPQPMLSSVPPQTDELFRSHVLKLIQRYQPIRICRTGNAPFFCFHADNFDLDYGC
jgi:hypothetical protein